MNKLFIVIATVVILGGVVFFSREKKNLELIPEESVLPSATVTKSVAPSGTLPISSPSLGSSPSTTPTPSTTSTPRSTLSPIPTASPKPSTSVTPTETPAPKTHNVTIQGFAFVESSLNIKKGDTVIWTNKDSAPHTVTGSGLDSPTLSANGTFSFTFNATGTFNYKCAFHPSMMGTVVVTQ